MGYKVIENWAQGTCDGIVVNAEGRVPDVKD